MKINIKWLKEHLDTNANANQIIDALNEIGLPCVNNCFDKCWHDIEIVKIISKKKHEHADKLNIYEILTGNHDIYSIVCGDPTLEIGDHVPFAKIGTVLPGNFIIQKRRIRYIDSFGMLCAANEFNFILPSNGVMRCYSEDFGKTIAQAYEDEGIIEIEVTPNRGEALSVRGVARMLSLHCNLGALKDLNYSNFINDKNDENIIKINTKDCLGLECAVVEYEPKTTNLKIIKYLKMTGHEPKNIDIIDYTNFIAHDVGQPMHVFDYDKIQGEINLTNLESDQKFETLKNEVIELDANSLVIKNESEILSWPGIIGGKNSSVCAQTKRILIETGIFKIDSIQRRKHKINTSSSKKNEYGLDYNNLKIAMNLFLKLIDKKPIKKQSYTTKFEKYIPFEYEKIERFLGVKIDKNEFIEIMKKQGFSYENDNFIPPSWLYFNIFNFNCILEEFILYKHQDLISQNLALKPMKNIENNLYNSDEIALTLGFNECKNFKITTKEQDNFFRNNVKIINASNKNYSYMRSTLMNGLLNNLSWHIKNKHNISDFFEIGEVFNCDTLSQSMQFAAISMNYELLKSLIMKILAYNNFKTPVIESIHSIYIERGSSFYLQDFLIARIGVINKELLKEYSIKEAFYLEIYLDNFKRLDKKNKPCFYVTPPIYQDVSFNLVNKELGQVINYLNSKYIYEIIDIYPNLNYMEDKKILVKFQLNFPQTVTKEEINAKIKEITNDVCENLNVTSN